MASERVGDMTLDELKTLIQEEIKRQRRGVRILGGKRSVAEINASIDQHLWTPPPGTPSSVDLLREDRDR